MIKFGFTISLLGLLNLEAEMFILFKQTFRSAIAAEISVDLLCIADSDYYIN